MEVTVSAMQATYLLIALWSLLLRLRAMDMDRWADMVGHRGGGQDSRYSGGHESSKDHSAQLQRDDQG